MGISDNVQLALIVAIPPLIAVPITAWVNNWSQRKSKASENDAAEKIKRLEAELRKAEKDEDAARARREREEDRLAAQELLSNTAKTANAALATVVKLEEVHVLVNSNYTAALEATFEALQAKLVVLLDSVAFKKEHGTTPPLETITDIETTKTKIAELRVVIDERRANDKAASALKKHGPSVILTDSPRSPKPVPVADNRTAIAAEQTAIETRRAADAQVKQADIAERVANKP